MESQNLPDLPPEVVLYEILTRTSPDTLGRCRAVWKRWNKATYDSSFAQLFNDRTKTVAGFFVQTMRKLNYSLTFVSMNNSNEAGFKPSLSFLPCKKVKIEAAAKQGLLLCLHHPSTLKPTVPQYIICKPTTQQWRKIPNPKTRYFTLKTSVAVMGSNPLRFKIVRFSEPKSCPCGNNNSAPYSSLRCEIFDSRTWDWKTLSENIRLRFCEFLDSTVSACAFLYCFTTERRFLAFDWEKESWELFGLPKPLCDGDYCHRRDMHVVEYESRLGLACMVSDDCMELWVTEDCRKKTWSLKKKVGFSSERYNNHILPVAFCNTDVALMKDYDDIVFCNFKGSVMKEFRMKNALRPGIEQFFGIESDLEQVECMKRD